MLPRADSAQSCRSHSNKPVAHGDQTLLLDLPLLRGRRRGGQPSSPLCRPRLASNTSAARIGSGVSISPADALRSSRWRKDRPDFPGIHPAAGPRGRCTGCRGLVNGCDASVATSRRPGKPPRPHVAPIHEACRGFPRPCFDASKRPHASSEACRFCQVASATDFQAGNSGRHASGGVCEAPAAERHGLASSRRSAASACQASAFVGRGDDR